MKRRILAMILISIIFISLFLNYSYKEGLQSINLTGNYVDLIGQHSLCKNPNNKPTCNKKEGCGPGFVNLAPEVNGNFSTYRCTNPGGPFQTLNNCPYGLLLSKDSRGCLQVQQK